MSIKGAFGLPFSHPTFWQAANARLCFWLNPVNLILRQARAADFSEPRILIISYWLIHKVRDQIHVCTINPSATRFFLPLLQIHADLSGWQFLSLSDACSSSTWPASATAQANVRQAHSLLIQSKALLKNFGSD
jgi:hypothetical protein